MKILVFGNPLVEEDSLAIRLIPKLQRAFPEINFKEFDPTESLEKEGRDLIILDVAQGIDEIKIIDDIDKLETIKSVSMHDFDLSYNLKLLKKIGKLDSVKIIAVPQGMGGEEAFEGVSELLREWRV